MLRLIGAVLIFISALLLSGCISTKRYTDADVRGLLLQHQTEITRLEEELRNRDRTVENTLRELRTITSRSTSMEGTIDELIELFDEYQRRINQFIQDYNTLRTQVKN